MAKSNNTIANEAMDFLKKRFAKQCQMDDSGVDAGKLRRYSGDTVEKMVGNIWCELVQNHNGGYCKIGDNDAAWLVNDMGQKEFAVDVHCYAIDYSGQPRAIMAIECKTYLDSSFAERASGDFKYMNRTNSNFENNVIVSLENAVNEQTFGFWMGEGNIDCVLFLSDHRRSSNASERIYRHPERISADLMNALVEKFDSFITESINQLSFDFGQDFYADSYKQTDYRGFAYEEI